MLITDLEHQTPAWHVLYTTYPVVEENYPLALTFSKTSTWLAMEDHPFSNLLTEVQWEALKKQSRDDNPRDDNPLEERYVAAPFKIDHSCHLLAGLLQVVGVLAPSPCRTCEKDCGRWATCVTSYDHSSIDIAKGACANCLYTSAGRGCSFRDSLPQDTVDTDTNPELKELEGKGFPTHFAAREAIKQAQQHNGYQIVTQSGNLRSGKPLYQKYRCFRYDDLTSGGVKIHDPCFWSTRVDLVDGSWVVQQPEGTHSHDAVDYSVPKPRWRCDVCEQYFYWFEKDSHICPGTYVECYKCIDRFPKSELAVHRLTCPWLLCSTCQMPRIEDMKQHREECPGRLKIRCWKCRHYHEKDKHREHFEGCEYWYCRHCLTAILASERDKHQKTCEDWQCAICFERMKESQMDEHLPNCPI